MRRLGIDSDREAVIFMRADCHICRAVGFTVQSRVRVTLGTRSLVVTLNVVTTDLPAAGEGGLSEVAWKTLRAKPGETSCPTSTHRSATSKESIHVRIQHSAQGHILGAFLAIKL